MCVYVYVFFLAYMLHVALTGRKRDTKNIGQRFYQMLIFFLHAALTRAQQCFASREGRWDAVGGWVGA